MKRKVGNNPKTWTNLIPKAMLAYCNTAKIGSGYHPFTLALGIDIVASAKLIWPKV